MALALGLCLRGPDRTGSAADMSATPVVGRPGRRACSGRRRHHPRSGRQTELDPAPDGGGPVPGPPRPGARHHPRPRRAGPGAAMLRRVSAQHSPAGPGGRRLAAFPAAWAGALSHLPGTTAVARASIRPPRTRRQPPGRTGPPPGQSGAGRGGVPGAASAQPQAGPPVGRPAEPGGGLGQGRPQRAHPPPGGHRGRCPGRPSSRREPGVLRTARVLRPVQLAGCGGARVRGHSHRPGSGAVTSPRWWTAAVADIASLGTVARQPDRDVAPGGTG